MPENFSWVDILLYIHLFGIRRVKFRIVRLGVGCLTGLIENKMNSAKLELELELSLAILGSFKNSMIKAWYSHLET